MNSENILQFLLSNMLSVNTAINSEIYLINLSCLRLLSLYHTDFFSTIDQQSEDDIKTLLWSIFIEPIFTNSIIKAKGFTGFNHAYGNKKDLLLCNNDNEFGCGVGELKWMESSTNVLFDSTLKNLKVLKDMIWSLAKKLNNDEAVVRELQLVGFAFNQVTMGLSVMDLPGGISCRVRDLNSITLTGEKETMTSNFVAAAKLVWVGRLIAERSAGIVNSYRTPNTGVRYDDNSDKEVIPEGLRSPKRIKTAVASAGPSSSNH